MKGVAVTIIGFPPGEEDYETTDNRLMKPHELKKWLPQIVNSLSAMFFNEIEDRDNPWCGWKISSCLITHEEDDETEEND